jgi:hypothetical protein
MATGSNPMKRSYRALTVFLALVLIPMVAVSGAWAGEQLQEPQVEIFFKRLAIAPVFVGHRIPSIDETLDDTLSCNISEICVDDPNISATAGSMLTRLIHSTLINRFGPNVVPLEDAQTAYADLRLDDARDTPRTLSRRLGKSLSADLIVIGTVWRYRDKGAIEGFPEKPASVAFALYLVEPETGRRIWRGIFDETQEYALKDMSKFTDRIKMGFKWLSGDQLARYGVKQILSGFPSYVIPRVDDSAKEKAVQ